MEMLTVTLQMDPKCSPLITSPLLFLRESTRTGITVSEETVDRMESQGVEEVDIIMGEKEDRGTSSAGCHFCHYISSLVKVETKSEETLSTTTAQSMMLFTFSCLSTSTTHS